MLKKIYLIYFGCKPH